MKLDIGRVLADDKTTLEFSCQADFSELEMADGVKPFSQVCVSGSVRSRYEAVSLVARIRAEGKIPCARCLRETAVSFDLPLDCVVTDEPDEDGFPVITGGHFLDLHSAVREALFDAYPSKALCREDCAGLCPVCGQNRNDGPCACEK